MITRGWEGAARFRYEYEDERVEVLSAVSILGVAEALGVQIHPPPGLTCPDPAHGHQTGRDAPASVFVGAEGYELWKCHGCGAAGTAIDYVLRAGGAESYAEALEVLQELAISPAAALGHHAVSRYRTTPEDPDRCSPVRDAALRSTCEQWCAARQWYPGLETLLRGQWSFVQDWRGLWLRLHADADRSGWWQDRAIGGQCKPDGEPWRWRFPAGRSPELTVWEPSYVESVRREVRDQKRLTRYRVREELDHTPAVPPRPLVVEGGSDLITTVAAQEYLPIARRFVVVALPGAGRSDLLADRDDWTVLVDNDDAGDRCRDAIDAAHCGVRHLEVPAPFQDCSEWWASIHHLDRAGRDRWINELRDALEGP